MRTGHDFDITCDCYRCRKDREQCIRWGVDSADRCIRPYDHLGQCEDAQGNTTMTLAAQYLMDAAAADTHSSDVDPGRIDPWEER